MAKIVTLEILVDSDNESEIADGLNDMLRTAQLPVARGVEPRGPGQLRQFLQVLLHGALRLLGILPGEEEAARGEFSHRFPG